MSKEPIHVTKSFLPVEEFTKEEGMIWESGTIVLIALQFIVQLNTFGSSIELNLKHK
tara:strand:- start:713 stop:883 length:171 start_codon:yes stop_codon:yes gene_type:complete